MFFSILVPIYNTELYLEQCINSILNQTHTHFELILVNDGSTDRCPAICDSYAQKDSRVQVIHKPNGGLVSARQAGIEKAVGDYIIHVDSDDWITPDFLEKANRIIHTHQPDILSFAIQYTYPHKTEYHAEPVPQGIYTGEALKTQILPHILLNENMEHMHYYQWCKAIKRKLATPIQLQIPTTFCNGEDVASIVPAYLTAKKVYISSDAVYHCRCHSNSMSRKFHAEYFEQGVLLMQHLQKFISVAPAQFTQSIDRYMAYTALVLMAIGAESGQKDNIHQIEKHWCTEYDQALQHAKFKKISPKSRLVFWLLKHKKIKTAYRVLRLSEKIKRR